MFFKSNHCRNLSLKKDSKTAVTALSTQLLGLLVKFTFYVILTLNVLFAYPTRLCWDLFLRVLMRPIQVAILCVDKIGPGQDPNNSFARNRCWACKNFAKSHFAKRLAIFYSFLTSKILWRVEGNPDSWKIAVKQKVPIVS